MKNGQEVTPQAARKYEQIEYCRTMIQKFIPKGDIIKALSEHFCVTLARAYQIYNSTVKHYGLQNLHAEAVLQQIYQTKQTTTDSKAMALCDKNLIMAVAHLHNQESRIKEITPPPIEVGFFPQLLEVELPSDEKIEDFKAQLYKMIEQDALDVDYIIIDEKQENRKGE